MTEIVGGGRLERFSSRLGRLSHVYLKDRLRGASEYLRIAGYFRSSIFELINEEIETIGKVRVVCNADLDPQDIVAAKQAREQLLKERWHEVDDTVESFLRRPRYRRLFDILQKGNVEIRVVSRTQAPFLHGKAGVIRGANGAASAFMGTLNETLEGWSGNYELVWEDTSADGIAWVEEEFEHLWSLGKPLPDAIVDEIGRSARRVEVQLAALAPSEIAPAALVESDLYRGGEQLMPWQRAFVSLFLSHRERYGKVRLLLADEVGVGKTLSLAASALVSTLLEDGPVLILCPATLAVQWQIELTDKLNIPSAVWLSTRKAWQLDPDQLPLPSVGPEGILRCPRQIGIVSTGLIFHDTEERSHLLKKRFGTIILDEAHRARGSKVLGKDERSPNNLLKFMREAVLKARHVLLGTATPIQTDIADLWDLMTILAQDAPHVLGDAWSPWRRQRQALPLITGEVRVRDAREAWDWFRNPLPSGKEAESVFSHIRAELEMKNDAFVCARPYGELSDMRWIFDENVLAEKNGLGFFQRNNPIVRHVVLRRRKALEDADLLPRIPVDIHPVCGEALPIELFDGVGLRTDAAFDAAYEAAEQFTQAFGKRRRSAGLLKGFLRERLCSSYASGISTAKTLLAGEERRIDDEDAMLVLGEIEIVEDERRFLQAMIDALSCHPTDPKLQAALYFLLEKNWLNEGCIIFSRFYDTTKWIAQCLTDRLPNEAIAVYAGAGKSGIYKQSEWCSVEREYIKKSVKERLIRLVVATDAACEGLNLQTLGTLINIDLPWNPSRLEQRIGRIKRFGQRRERVDMLNLVYHDTIDEKVYQKLSERMQDRYDIFGTLPDVIEDEWIENIEKLDEELKEYTNQQRQANAFDLRYAADVKESEQRWELCEKVLARHDVVERLSRAWGNGK